MTAELARPALRALVRSGRGAVLAVLIADAALGMSPLAVRILDEGRVQGWERRDFQGRTRYQADVLEGEPVLRADAAGDASGLYLTRAVQLSETPRLRWRWRVRDALDNPGERTLGGDDFVARVYVISAHPVMFWRSRAICYVWASSAPPGETWINPHAAGVKMVALQSGSRLSGRWVSESRDVAADFRRLFGRAPARVDAVAIMTDTDDTGLRATAWYDDLEWAASPGS